MTPNTSNSNQHDANLEQTVRDALDRYPPLRMWQHSIQIQANNGAVILSGSARSQAEKQIAGNLARAVKGATSVENQLIADGDLEIAIAQALATDARTRDAFPGVLVGVVFGTVYLKGTAVSDDVKKAASEIASKIGGILRVSNELVVLAKPAA
jgi:osmotically-inducible protein OsmY